jgi:hypothetical protein
MGRFLRWGFCREGHRVDVQHASLSDVGCTMRLASGPALREMEPHFTVSDGAFGPEMMLLSIIGGWRVVQIPVNYRARGGERGTTEQFWTALTIGLQMNPARLSVPPRAKSGGCPPRSRPDRRPPTPRPGAPAPGGEPTHMFPRLKRRRASSR